MIESSTVPPADMTPAEVFHLTWMHLNRMWNRSRK